VTGKYLLDTNVVIALFNGDEKITKWMAKTGEVLIPNIVIGELYYGSLKSKLKKDNIRKIEEFIVAAPVISTDLDSARVYGKVKYELSKKGKPIPENDIWIAALAIQNDLTLVSYDRHFKNIGDLSLKLFRK
jgi:tRNA(fMet)-specific endonuclease VapC